MSQKSQAGRQSTQPGFLPEASNNIQDKSQDPAPITPSFQVSLQEPLPVKSHQVSIQDPLPVGGRQVSLEVPLPVGGCRVSFEVPLPVGGRHVSLQDTRSITYSRHFDTQDVLPTFQTRYLSVRSPPLTTHTPWTNMESRTYGKQDHPPRPQSLHAGVQGSMLPIQAKTSVPHSITHSPDASRKSVESMIWTSKESFEDFEDSTQLNQNTLESSIHNLPSDSSLEVDSGRIQKIRRHRHSRLPTGWWLLQQAKKFSHQLSLILSLAGMMIIGCISLGQAWIHFQVPLTPPGDPAGPLTIPIDTILFTQCFNISCMHEYDRTAYFLDVTWIFLFVAFITSFCLSIVLINIVFFTSSNLPTLDFSNIISSILTGSSMILGVLFYLRQAHEYLQEGMTYRLGCSFYLAWTGVFLFLMTGFFSYLNYVNFWSSMMLQAV
ncbi:uncharacterized protein [Manis javanica]|uniref:uncharacterized protein isoform X2 n=1 Tax=Manis javanica TaxID=9974 RepID=UPI003C6D7C75